MKFIILSEAEMVQEIENAMGNYQVLCCSFFGEELTAIRFDNKGPSYVMDVDVESLLADLSREKEINKEDLN